MAVFGYKDLDGQHVALDWAAEGDWMDFAINSAADSMIPTWYTGLRRVHEPTAAHAQLMRKHTIRGAPWVTYRGGVEMVYPEVNWYLTEMFNDEDAF